MTVILANPRGFCAGVNMAIESLSRALQQYGPPVYVFHEIVHNRHVVEDFRNKGAVFVDSIDNVPSGSVVLFSAHGVSPEVRAKSLEAKHLSIDATCPLVTKVHLEVTQFARAGYTIVLIGHEGHDEVVGTIGEAPQSVVLVEKVSDVAALDFPAGTKLAYLTQTTLSVDETEKVIQALRAKFPDIVGPKRDDICYATQNRQDAVRTLSNEADLILVVGSRNSSNSVRLTEISNSQGVPAYLIDDADQILPEWLEGKKAVVLTAGASAPESIVQRCAQMLKDKYSADVVNFEGRKENVTFALPRQLREK